MELITAFELAKHNQQELRALYRRISAALNLTAPGSPERLNALASLENIERALCRVSLTP